MGDDTREGAFIPEVVKLGTYTASVYSLCSIAIFFASSFADAFNAPFPDHRPDRTTDAINCPL